MNENDFARAVSRFLENDLPPSERDELLAAVEANPQYRAAFVAQVRLSVRLESLHHDAADPRVVQRTQALLGARGQGLRTLGEVQRRLRTRRRPPLWVWALAAAGLLVAAFFIGQRPPAEPPAHVRAPEPWPPEPFDPAQGKPPPAPPREEPPPPKPPETPAPVEAPKPPPAPKPTPSTPAPEPKPPDPIDPARAQPPPPEEKPPPPRETRVAVARVEAVTGEASLWTPSGRRPLRAGQDLLPGEGVQAAGEVTILFADKTRLEVGPNTLLKGLTEEGGKRLQLDKGTLRAQVAQQPPDRPFTVRTPQGEARVVGTTLRLVVDDGTRLDVTEGKVQLKRLSDGKTVDVEAGHYAVAAVGVDLAAWAHPLVIDLNDFGNARDAKPAEGPVRRIYADTSNAATGGVCVGAPGVGTLLEGPLVLAPGAWFAWIRFRDTDLGPVSFQVLVDGRLVETIVGDGFLKKPWEKWNWRRVGFESKAKVTRFTLRSTSEALRFDRGNNTYAVVNRWDSIILTRDPGFRP